LPLEPSDKLHPLPLLNGHVFGPLVIFGLAGLLDSHSMVVRIILGRQETAFRVCHGAHIEVDKFSELARRAQGLIITFVTAIAIGSGLDERGFGGSG
jgi:hypothetical protein